MPQSITRRDILGPSRYAPVRDDYRRRIIAIKKLRRVILGDRVSVVFENRDTMLFQIEEMLRAEQLTDERGIQAEIDVYAAMLPGAQSLSATLFIELAADADSRVELGKFIGLDEHVVLEIGNQTVRAAFEAGRGDDERISAVQFVRFELGAGALAALAREGTEVALAITHPGYAVRTLLSEEQRKSLAKDLDCT